MKKQSFVAIDKTDEVILGVDKPSREEAIEYAQSLIEEPMSNFSEGIWIAQITDHLEPRTSFSRKKYIP